MELCLFFNDILKMGLYDSSLDRKKLFPEPFTFKIVSREPEICCTHPSRSNLIHSSRVYLKKGTNQLRLLKDMVERV